MWSYFNGQPFNFSPRNENVTLVSTVYGFYTNKTKLFPVFNLSQKGDFVLMTGQWQFQIQPHVFFIFRYLNLKVFHIRSSTLWCRFWSQTQTKIPLLVGKEGSSTDQDSVPLTGSTYLDRSPVLITTEGNQIHGKEFVPTVDSLHQFEYFVIKVK